MPFWPITPARATGHARRLLDGVIQASRRAAFYGEGRAPDTLEGRFEVMTLHAALALYRLKQEPDAGALSQRFTDALFRHFDAGLREAGVGDLTVPKRMRALAGAFYGRLQAYTAALEAGDAAALQAAVARNIGVDLGAHAADLAQRAAAMAGRQAAAPIAALETAEGWTFA